MTYAELLQSLREEISLSLEQGGAGRILIGYKVWEALLRSQDRADSARARSLEIKVQGVPTLVCEHFHSEQIEVVLNRDLECLNELVRQVLQAKQETGICPEVLVTPSTFKALKRASLPSENLYSVGAVKVSSQLTEPFKVTPNYHPPNWCRVGAQVVQVDDNSRWGIVLSREAKGVILDELEGTPQAFVPSNELHQNWVVTEGRERIYSRFTRILNDYGVLADLADA